MGVLVQSARFAGLEASDEDNFTKLLGDLGDWADRRARFVCAHCLIIPMPDEIGVSL
jgi:inosine/xanthosine triphosphate pyrophosphatase family protein